MPERNSPSGQRSSAHDRRIFADGRSCPSFDTCIAYSAIGLRGSPQEEQRMRETASPQ